MTMSTDQGTKVRTVPTDFSESDLAVFIGALSMAFKTSILCCVVAGNSQK